MTDPIVQIGDSVLLEKAKPLSKKEITSPKIQALIKRMKGVLAKEKYGVAIAAPQLGIPVRLFVVAGQVFEEDSKEKTTSQSSQKLPTLATEMDRVYINPEVTRVSKKQKELSEGCLSVRGKYGTVLRHEKATLKALDENGKPLLQHASGLLAHIFQHETDHLEGVLFVDKVIRIEDWDEHKHGEGAKV